MMAPLNVIIVVLGDIGRSPRMQYHAASFLQEGFTVNLIGYSGSKPNECLQSHNNCSIKYLPQTPKFVQKLPRLAAYLFKVIWQIMTLLWALALTRKSRYLLVQTPPAIPSLAVCWFYCRLRGMIFNVDWHNYAYTIMALTHGKKHKLVTWSEWFEGTFGYRADGSLCVTKAMKEDLERRWNIRAVTLYDRPPEHFRSITAGERQSLFSRYSELSSAKMLDYNGQLLSNRPALLVSSTSWTEDEDFSILLFALQEYEKSKDPSLPSLLCVITGKGPMQQHYMKLISSQSWSKVSVVSLWLEAEDYPRLLASADLGVSLHTSSSGLDLPMKVVDMFGCGLPVAALNFPCLKELVRHNENGLVFSDSKELAQQLQDWFKGFPNNSDSKKFKTEIQKFQSLRWHENWKTQAFPVFNKQ